MNRRAGGPRLSTANSTQRPGRRSHGVLRLPLFMDVHNLGNGVSMDDVAQAHQADLATQGEYRCKKVPDMSRVS